MNNMLTAIRLAQKGRGHTKTNPCVGAVVAKDGQIVGYGWHQEYGGPHAEPNALMDAGENAEGGELFVTLEPCSTHGKTPPCTDAIIAAGIKRVYIGVPDPNPAHAGAAVHILRKAGIDVHMGLMADDCALLIEDFTKYVKTGHPYVTMKVAQSMDGKIATSSGQSQWITSQDSLVAVHKLRKYADAVLVGVGTVLADNPMLTVRHVDADRQPIRVVLDSRGRTPADSALAESAKDIPVIIFTSDSADEKNLAVLENKGVQIVRAPLVAGKLDLRFVLKSLGEMQVMNLLVEGGGEVFGSFMDGKYVDRLELFVAPFIIGGSDAKSAIGGNGLDKLENAEKLLTMEIEQSGADTHISGRLKEWK
jgi:diaminohydroxyphosphoribosylaminopyrimidine deaminase/5-amino-6-(5-phosphoribosylamino)uracil reductase